MRLRSTQGRLTIFGESMPLVPLPIGWLDWSG